MTNFIEAIAKSLKGNEYAERSFKFFNNLISFDDNESDEAVVIRKGNCEIRISDEKIELIHDRLVSTKLVITKGDIFVKWRDGGTLNLDDAKRVAEFFLRPQPPMTISDPTNPININAQAPLSFDPNTGNLAIALSGTSPITFNSATGAIGTKLNPRPPFQWDSETGQLNIGIWGQLPITFNSTTGAVGIRFNPVSPLTYDTTSGNLGFDPTLSNLTLTAPNVSTVPLRINTVTSGANSIEVRRADNTLGFTVYNSGSVEVGVNSVYRHNGLQILGARRTGWTPPTGTATRTAYATSTATAVQVAERLKALIDDLIFHGIIGT